MEFIDYLLPHRLLLNHELRKEADKLRETVSAYQEDYKNKISQVNEEIERAISEANADVQKAKESLIAQLSSDQELLKTVQNNLFEYVDVYFQHKSAKRVLELLCLEQKSILDNISFLTNYMKLLGEEIEILEDRKNKLTTQTDIGDVIALLNLSGCDLIIEDSETAKTLLDKVYIAASESEKGSARRNALFKLVEKLQERAELLPLITYISWIIQQKIQFSKELSRKRNQLKDENSSKKSEITNTQNTIDQLARFMMDIARRVREYWAAPLAELAVELSAYYYQKRHLPKYSERATELREYCEEHKEVSRQLKSMAESHSDDSYKWDRLQRERKELSDKIEDAKADLERIKNIESSIDSTKKKRNDWFEKRKFVLEICNQNNIYLLSDKDSGESDEIRIVSERLNGYLQRQTEIDDENRAALEHIHKEKDDSISKLEEDIGEAYITVKNAQDAYNKTKLTLTKLEESDNRFFLVKLFKESEEVANTKKQLSAKANVLKAAQEQLNGLVSEKEMKEKAFDKEIRAFRGIHDVGLVSSIEKYRRRHDELLTQRHANKTREEETNEG